MNNNILPAIRNIKDLEKLIKTDYKMCVLLDMHIGHIKSIMELLKQNHIECFIHIDLIKGLSHDEFASEFIIQQYKPKGIVSTKSKVIKKAKSLNTLTIFRVFIIDSQALKRSIDLIKKWNLILLKYFQVLRVKRFIIFRKKQTHKSLQVA
ncbi:glycerol uptake operon antiterminator regulatory protein [Staphylococcus aureus M1071]|nr:glycerol uptake operon antiterminator regulatory protein [Staphylococcus aureus M1036]EUI30070.1 glycerol uptake operon antiterminator regulatory protein [Staphylococcus aureus M1114]EUI38775.1 glycerol uptake operon antiterminator regulatory protein [Staphylococcus aureus M1125]EUO37987.1 glycerol uptake operon antiterminator regulatory protein [Staphylococcus aureus M1071]EVP02241.1 glycerol uptake operon antiterminator regulatory protein [Staphylococcus aureus M1091]